MPATYTFYDRGMRPWPNRRLDYGLIVGHTTTDTARIWLRMKWVEGAHLFYAEKSERPRQELFPTGDQPLANLRRRSGLMEAAVSRVENGRDRTAVVDLSGLRPDTEYVMALWSETQGKFVFGHDHAARFRTLPTGHEAPMDFMLYSCHMPFKDTRFDKPEVEDMSMWHCLNAILNSTDYPDIRFCIAGGDQVYTDGVGSLNIWKWLDGHATVQRGSGDPVDRLRPTRDEMLSLYRDIYRGFWGFNELMRPMSSCPTYMIWDDHELSDGWGSFVHAPDRSQMDRAAYRAEEMDERLPDALARFKKTYGRDQALTICDALIARMGSAAKQVYDEYEHSHNPDTDTAAGVWDYGYYSGEAAVYVLDGRGHRDINRPDWRILGKPQFDRFAAWLDRPETRRRRYLFVVSAVPFIHFREFVTEMAETFVADAADIQDDLRDHWEHEMHNDERRAVLDLLFAQAEHQCVSILSGDVHVSASFSLTNGAGRQICQITSSAITYNVGRFAGWILEKGIPKCGKTIDDHKFVRKSFFAGRNVCLVRTGGDKKQVNLEFFSPDSIAGRGGVPSSSVDRPIPISTVELTWS